MAKKKKAAAKGKPAKKKVTKPTAKKATKPAKKTKSDAELELRDKLKAAVHEAGHFVVAVVSGKSAEAYLRPSNTDDSEYDSTWVGQCRVLRVFGVGGTPAIAVAGAVADCLNDDPDTFANDICDYIEDEGEATSLTDKSGTPDDGQELFVAVKQALAILKRNRKLFDRVVSELVANEYIDSRTFSLGRIVKP